MYFGSQCYGNALNCPFVYLIIPGTRPLFKRKQNLFISFTFNIENTRDVFYVRIVVYLMKTAKLNAYNMYIFGKIELLSIHVT